MKRRPKTFIDNIDVAAFALPVRSSLPVAYALKKLESLGRNFYYIIAPVYCTAEERCPIIRIM